VNQTSIRKKRDLFQKKISHVPAFAIKKGFRSYPEVPPYSRRKKSTLKKLSLSLEGREKGPGEKGLTAEREKKGEPGEESEGRPRLKDAA